MKVGLCMIVKNEAHIIHESLSCTLPLISTYCIVDTGSTDNTIEIIKNFYTKHGISGTVHERAWKNFGHNRSEALTLCDGMMDYALVIDADDTIEFPTDGNQTLQNILTTNPDACNILIKQETIEYWRSQIFKCNNNWGYTGVLHEYPSNGKPSNKFVQLPREIFMNSRRLGSRNLVGDKPKRDIAVLLKGIEDEPNNERYVFYLAQSYKDDGDNLNAIKYYKKRFEMKRWYEEAWFSAFQVGVCYKRINNIPKFEYWMQKAHNFHPFRAEPMYHLTEYFRSTGSVYKAYEYCNIGSKIAYPKNDALFIEKFPYAGGFLYEKTILDYYIHSDKKIGLRDSFSYLIKNIQHASNVISNLKFYIKPIDSTYTTLDIPSIFGEEFRPTAVSVYDYPLANVRFVNYMPPVNGEYKTKNGSPIVSKNATYNIETKECTPIPDNNPLFESAVKGLEDMRVYKSGNKIFYTASNYYEYQKDKVSIVHGEYGISENLIESPVDSKCEKNWLHLKNHEFIYNWHPLRIGIIEDNIFKITKTIETPPLFSLFRGSAVVEYENSIVALVHFCEYSKSRNYYHCFVKLNKDTYQPIQVSLPFVFKNVGIEYCVSFHNTDFFVTFNDETPTRITINSSSIEWMSLYTNTITRKMKDANVYWAGKYSTCVPNGTIENIVLNTNANKSLHVVFAQEDAIFSNEEYIKAVKNTDASRIIVSPESTHLDVSNNSILCALATRDFSSSNLILLPLDDDTCRLGLHHIFPIMPEWELRKSVVFWRGNTSGYERPTIRERVIRDLYENPHADVKFAILGDTGIYAKSIDKKFISERCEIETFLQYKYLLIIDGSCIASNLQWVFGSGSVPILVTHPKNNWWFKSYVKNMENCVVISYDLSDLQEKIAWLIENDEKAKEIVINAKKLAATLFTPDFQKEYIRKILTMS
jgi:hypothetical protein